MALEEYRKKRRFDITPEPVGRTRPRKRSGTPIFVVQMHQATNLHYDLRLEIDGVLASWAVPKGPTLNPSEKRLAMQTEDHPVEYAGFEGVIPEGEYGAGAMMVWDKGRFRIEGEVPAAEQLARGSLKFLLEGEKLKGSFALVRSFSSRSHRTWLLIKRSDQHAVRPWNIERYGASVVTGRTLRQIAESAPVRDRMKRMTAAARKTIA